MTRRIERVNELLREELGRLLRDLRDPRLTGMISVTNLSTSPDLSHAVVHVSIFGGDVERETSLAGLRKAAGYLRHELSGRVKLRHVPALDFRLDDSLDRGMRIFELLEEAAVTQPEPANGGTRRRTVTAPPKRRRSAPHDRAPG